MYRYTASPPRESGDSDVEAYTLNIEGDDVGFSSAKWLSHIEGLGTALIDTSGLIFPSDVYFLDVDGMRKAYHNPHGYNVMFDVASETETIDNEPIVRELARKIESFREFKEGWNGYGAPSFSDRVINIALWVASKDEITPFKPEVFPTGRNSIQFELVNDEGKEVELEVFDMDNAVVLFIDEDGEMTEMEYSINEALSTIHEFLR